MFALDTKDYMNLIYEYKKQDLVSYSNSDWAGDPETRICVTGFVIKLLGASICWRSKGQQVVLLTSCEAQYITMSEAVKEIKFIYYLLKGMGVEVKLPIIVRSDNMGAILMHQMYTRYH